MSSYTITITPDDTTRASTTLRVDVSEDAARITELLVRAGSATGAPGHPRRRGHGCGVAEASPPPAGDIAARRGRWSRPRRTGSVQRVGSARQVSRPAVLRARLFTSRQARCARLLGDLRALRQRITPIAAAPVSTPRKAPPHPAALRPVEAVTPVFSRSVVTVSPRSPRVLRMSCRRSSTALGPDFLLINVPSF